MDPPPPTSSTVQDMLLQEARTEIGRLRTENFQSKRLAEERLSALQRVSAEREQLLHQCHQLQVHALRTLAEEQAAARSWQCALAWPRTLAALHACAGAG